MVNLRTTRGFTLLELMVAMSVFVIVATIAVGGFVGALRAQRQIAALISANNNVSLALEEMMREIRTGRDFCIPQCNNNVLTFVNARREFITYRQPFGTDYIERGVGAGFSAVFERMTSRDVSVRYLNFIANTDQTPPAGGVGPLIPESWRPPRITVYIGLSSKQFGISDKIIHLQTTVSSAELSQ